MTQEYAKDYWLEGMSQYRQGKKRSDNPYKASSNEAESWDDGFDFGRETDYKLTSVAKPIFLDG